uniref:Uncharacterized protein n=1 Tax=Schistocephalus solidus TaxID=70667 RepID=A0A0X3NSL3_SCHSO
MTAGAYLFFRLFFPTRVRRPYCPIPLLHGLRGVWTSWGVLRYTPLLPHESSASDGTIPGQTEHSRYNLEGLRCIHLLLSMPTLQDTPGLLDATEPGVSHVRGQFRNRN